MKVLLVLFAHMWAWGGLGHLVLIGGGEKPTVAMERFISLAGGTSAEIVVLPTASADPTTPDYYRALFGRYGCSKVTVLDVKTSEDAALPQHLEVIRGAGGVFFSGGDQRKITRALSGSPLLRLLKERHLQGMVVAGTSAGTACMSARMLTGDGAFDRIAEGSVVHRPGLGLARNMVLDQHFIARGRQNRLLSVVLEEPNTVGVGVDEDTAIWIKPNSTFEVLGNGQVQVYNAQKAEIWVEPENRRFGAHNVTLHVLVHGDQFDLKTSQPARAAEAKE